MTAVCPAWCLGGHDPVDAFHRSMSSSWLSARRYYDERQPIEVKVEQHIDSAGELGSRTIVLEGKLSDFEDMMELDVVDAERLITALQRAVEVARA